MENGHYRLVTKAGKDCGILQVTDDEVEDGTPVKEYTEVGDRFIRVYPIHLPEDLWKEVEDEAMSVGISYDEVVEKAILNFFIYFRPAPGYQSKKSPE